jgi:hypothetical protein
MTSKWLTATAILLLAAGSALAQQEPQPKPQDLKKEDPVPPATDQNKSEQGGKQEPSAKITGTEGNPAAFANGKLTAPGAPVDVDTAPAKFSSRSAADDQLPTAAYRLRHLSAQQKSGIYGELAKAAKTSPASPNVQAFIGAAVPLDIILSGLQPLPDSITTKFPELNGLAFATLAGKPALVDPTMRIVADVAAP